MAGAGQGMPFDLSSSEGFMQWRALGRWSRWHSLVYWLPDRDPPPFSLQARPSWAALCPAGWGPRPRLRGARYPCPLTSPSTPQPPATCPWCSCGLPTPMKVRSGPDGRGQGLLGHCLHGDGNLMSPTPFLTPFLTMASGVPSST